MGLRRILKNVIGLRIDEKVGMVWCEYGMMYVYYGMSLCVVYGV